MQYVINLPTMSSDPRRFAELLQDDDPSAVIDRAPGLVTLRLSTCLSHGELRALAGKAGLILAADAVEQLPSECCGGCGG